MGRWDQLCNDLKKLDDAKQTNIFWCLLGHLEFLNNDVTYELLKDEVERRIKK